jgi:hypothetical protein
MLHFAVTPDVREKLPMLGTELSDFSLETVRMFHRDASAARLAF